MKKQKITKLILEFGDVSLDEVLFGRNFAKFAIVSTEEDPQSKRNEAEESREDGTGDVDFLKNNQRKKCYSTDILC
jgi:hypothetical protein